MTDTLKPISPSGSVHPSSGSVHPSPASGTQLRPPGDVGQASKGLAKAEPIDAAGYLLRALQAKSSEERRRLAEDGLWKQEEARRSRGAEEVPEERPHEGVDSEEFEDDEEDDELRALLLRQLYLCEIEDGEDQHALEIATEMIELGTLGDIARQDAARAAIGVNDLNAALGHLRIAARVCPPDRRAFHYGHLGALLRFAGQLDLALDAFAKATRWATGDRTLYLAAQALTEHQSGNTNADLIPLKRRLESEEPRKAYALWILGELCLVLGENQAAREYLSQFLSRQDGAPRAKSLSLAGEIAHANTLLKRASA